MVFTELTNKAMKIAYEAHHGTLDAEKIPYIFHPARVGSGFDTEAEVCVGLLHDVVEDTDITIEDLRKDGFPEDMLEALTLLTHEDGTDYMDYVKAAAKNPIAKAVKIADLRDNIAREPKGEGHSEKRLSKHLEALEYLLSCQ